MKKLLLFSGITTLVIFALTGNYMLSLYDSPPAEFDVQRMMYRASHVYLLWAGAASLLVGSLWSPVTHAVGRRFQMLGALGIVVAQPLLLIAFCLEPPAVDEGRNLTIQSHVMFLLSVGLIFIGSLFGRLSRNKDSG